MLSVMSEEEVDSPQTPTAVAPVTFTRKTRRKRKRRTEPQASKRTLIILLVGFTLVFALVAIPNLRHPFANAMRQALLKTHISTEWWALIIAALVILYLIPGVEDRLLRALGLRKEPRPNRRRRNNLL